MALPDFSHELAALLEHTARTAIAIRQHSPYSRPAGLSEPPENQYDLLWLADSLHNFDSLGRAIIEQNPDRIVFACDLLSSLYQRYGSEKNNSKGTFERARKYGISLDHAIDLFNQIRLKAADCQKPEQRGVHHGN